MSAEALPLLRRLPTSAAACARTLTVLRDAHADSLCGTRDSRPVTRTKEATWLDPAPA
jgi:hypothetical protein